MAGGKFIKLSNPAGCVECGRMIPKKRLGYWDAGSITCVPCYVRVYGVVPMTDEERALEDALQDNTNPMFEAGIPPRPPRKGGRKGD